MVFIPHPTTSAIMARDLIFPQQAGVIVLVLLLLKMTVVLCQQIDLSTIFPCSGATFPEVGRRICYERTVSPSPFNVQECSLEVIPSSNQTIELFQGRYTIYSPQFFVENGMYQNNRLCQYHVPTCPQNTITHLQWIQEEFTLEPSIQFGSMSLCLDYVRVFNLNLGSRGVALDSFGRLCGSPSTFQDLISSSTALQVEFASDTAERFRGFRIDVFCTPFGK